MITGAGEPLGDGDALGTGGGVTAPGDGDGGCGTRICGPCGATGRADVGRRRRRRGRRGGGRGRCGRRLRDLRRLPAAGGRAAALREQRERVRGVVLLRPRGTGIEQTAKESATAIALIRRSRPGHRSSRQTRKPPAAVAMTFGSHAATYGSSAPFLPNAPASATIP